MSSEGEYYIPSRNDMNVKKGDLYLSVMVIVCLVLWDFLYSAHKIVGFLSDLPDQASHNPTKNTLSE